MEVEDVPIADDATIEFREDERIEFSHIIRKKHVGNLISSHSFQNLKIKLGDSLRLKILRDGEEMEVSYHLKQLKPLVPVLHGLDCVPSYFIGKS